MDKITIEEPSDMDIIWLGYDAAIQKKVLEALRKRKRKKRK